MVTRHILLAEGRPNLQHSLSLMLKQAKYRVSLAETAEEAAALARALRNTLDPVELLIVDLDSASPEACRALMHTLTGNVLALPYLVLAEEIRDQAIESLKKHGCLACLIMPFEPEILLRSVQEAFARLPPQEGSAPENPWENPAPGVP